jgi:hypothetical protein
MNRYNRFFVTLVYQSHLEELLLSIAKAWESVQYTGHLSECN